MNEQQFQHYKRFQLPAAEIHASHLLHSSNDRTLFYGYNCDMGQGSETVHVYLKGGTIYHVTYFGSEPPTIIASGEVSPKTIEADLKRGYPESCDYEFCILLRRLGFDMPMTTFQSEGDLRRRAQNAGFAGRIASPA